jgi:hypothetical protein
MPEIHLYDRASASLVMEWLGTQRVMRKGMIDGVRYPRFAEHIAEHLAATLWGTSDWALPAAEKKRRIADFAGNTDLCRITEDLIFTDPYRAAERNRWTAPQPRWRWRSPRSRGASSAPPRRSSTVTCTPARSWSTRRAPRSSIPSSPSTGRSASIPACSSATC